LSRINYQKKESIKLKIHVEIRDADSAASTTDVRQQDVMSAHEGDLSV